MASSGTRSSRFTPSSWIRIATRWIRRASFADLATSEWTPLHFTSFGPRPSVCWSGGERLYLRFDQRSRPEVAALSHVSRRLRAAMPSGVRVGLRSVVGSRHPLLHVTDLLLGGVTGALNANVTSAGRLALLDMLTRALGRSPCEATGPNEHKFSIWLFEAMPGRPITGSSSTAHRSPAKLERNPPQLIPKPCVPGMAQNERGESPRARFSRSRRRGEGRGRHREASA